VVFGRPSYAVALALTLFVGQALAQGQTVVAKLVQMNQKALDDCDMREWDSAKKTLLDALVAGKKAGLDNHPVMARTYVNLGAVYLTGFKSRDKAIQSLSRGLEIDPFIELTARTATRELNQAYGEAKRLNEVAARARGSRTPLRRTSRTVWTAVDDFEEQDLPIKINALDCPNEDEAIFDRPATLRCAVTPNLKQVASVFLMYLEPNNERYTEQQMTRSRKGWYVGRIPKKAMLGKTVKYYFEGRDTSGKPIVRNGEVESPNILLLMEEDTYRAVKRREARWRED
jgi:hypothetical protein